MWRYSILTLSVHPIKSGRQLAAWLGLVPRQHSSGGKPVLLGISKRGDRYLRTLLVHGARSVIVRARKRGDENKGDWLTKLLDRRHVLQLSLGKLLRSPGLG